MQSWQPRTRAFREFATYLKYIPRLPCKWGQVIGSAAPITQNHLRKPRSDASVHFFESATSESAASMTCVGHLTSKSASHHNGVQFLISHMSRWLRTRRFSEPTFRPFGATNHCKIKAFRGFSTFSRTCIFFFLTLSLLTCCFLWLFPPLLFHLYILSEVGLLNLICLLYMIRWGFIDVPFLHWCSCHLELVNENCCSGFGDRELRQVGKS